MIKTQNLVAGVWQNNPQATPFQTVNPKTDKPLKTVFQEATNAQVEESVNKAAAIFDLYAETTLEQRTQFLQAIQKELKAICLEILQTYQEESALPEGRAQGEFDRTLGQILRFVELLQEGSFVQATIHTAGPDLRKMLHPIGPIGVFGASNFPLAFSTAGGDTISALAAGCPVIVKAHPYHAGTSALVAEAIHNALLSCGLPPEVFSHLGGNSHEIGKQLVTHPLLKGVGFTGSFAGGKALYDLAQTREEPIPVFAEMGSVNPIFITEKRLIKDKSLTETLAQSITLGTGQFCTNPGLILFCDPQGKSDLFTRVSAHINPMQLPPMVHSNIQKNYQVQLEGLTQNKALQNLLKSESSDAAVGLISGKDLLNQMHLTEEVFGPFSLFVHCHSLEEMTAVAEKLSGQLTATLLAEEEEYPKIKSVLQKLKNKVGRLLFEGVPTGVAVTQAMQHGGPYPASTDGRYTSVGTDSIYRWLRPVAFQDCPNGLLPLALQNENPLSLLRNLNGKPTKEVI